ncbi:DUF998 domain-containing protein [Microbispora sp. KK1-11]|uniref:DUF998 domain-containing protein n=1 Tax=Microbispora sp. KK1-11 TaxID=2053005 RepID=UPI00163CE395|nr:DUF998 domain-containing protein [Microbispora sp. KK1-11]
MPNDSDDRVPGGERVALRRLALTGVVGPILSVLVFTVAGALRPGYSPVHQAISALGNGAGGRLVDAVAVAMGAGLVVFAVVFATLLRPVLGRGVRRFAAVCIVLDGLGVATAGVFTDAPATTALHTAGASLGAISTLVAFAVIGVALRRDARWRRWGGYSLAAAVVALALVAAEYALLMPRSPLHALHVGGLLERADFVWHYAWYVAFGYRLFRGPVDAAGRVEPISSEHA